MPSDRANSSVSDSSVSNPFSDIGQHWAKACILAMAERRVISGYPDGRFRPDASITRAEFAVMLPIVFPDARPVREPIAFSDVSSKHWAYESIQQAYVNGWFSGYPDGTFQPNQPIARSQVMSVCVQQAYADGGPGRYPDRTFQVYQFQSDPDQRQPMQGNQAIASPQSGSTNSTKSDPLRILKLYFDDADQIPSWAQWTIAAAIQQDFVISYPTVRLFAPLRSATRGEIAAILCRVLKFNEIVPLAYATRSLGVYDLKGSVKVVFPQWRGSARLMRDIQVLLAAFRLYPGDRINGQYNSETEQALAAFCGFYGLSNLKTGVLDESFGKAITQADPIDYLLAVAKDRDAIYRDFLAQEEPYDENRLAFLDYGAENSPYYPDIAQFPDRLTAKPDGKKIVSLGDSLVLSGTEKRVFFNPFPAIGTLPAIDNSGLDFLHPDIQEACIGVGSFVDGTLQTRWCGRNALDNVELWSTTKIVPLINVVCQANAVQLDVPVRDCLVRPVGSAEGYGFYQLAVDLFSYGQAIASSNAVAATFKQFFTPDGLENWLKYVTGNPHLRFTGRYGEPPFIQNPDFCHQPTQTVLLKSAYRDHLGSNAVSTCDLARLMAMVGWHNHLPEAARLPAAQWSSLETIVRAMGMDTARYLEVAIDRLGLSSIIQSPVILSKLGFGRSKIRNRMELCYVALVWFEDNRSVRQGKPTILRTFSLALRAARGLNDADEEARQLDARVAAEVTEILRRIVTQELA